MRLEQQAKVRQRGPVRSALGVKPSPAADRTDNGLATSVLETLPGSVPCYASSAPGRLDVLGGIAEYAGALVLSMPLADRVCVGVRRRDDKTISVDLTMEPAVDGGPVTFPLSSLDAADGALKKSEPGRPRGASREAIADCVAGVLCEALRGGLLQEIPSGLDVAVGSTLRDLGDSGWETALAAATLGAVAQAFSIQIDAKKAVAACQRFQNDWLGWPVGPADAVCAFLGETNSLTQLLCQPCDVAGTVPIPDDLSIFGIECDACRPDLKVKHRRVRVATFMGRLLVDRIVRHEQRNHNWWDGYLSRISVSDYVGSLRDRIPTRMKGKDFLDHFGETGDSLTTIEPDQVYKIRSRTEHHIYEHARAFQFVECLARGMRTDDHRVFAEAGELMYASHWSYGQRCGLGDVRTDLIVNLVRKQGVGADLYGAKISGRGCGGLVAVLARTTDRAESAVEGVLESFKSKTGNEARLLRGSSSGALVQDGRGT